MDYKACMVSETNVDDPVTLSWFKAYLGGLDTITNQESKIKKPGAFEVHDQFITELGIQFLTNAFEHFLDEKASQIKVDDPVEAEKLILDFLRENGIVFYYDPETSEETEIFDDLLSYSRDLCSRTVLSVISDKLEEECDALGLRAFRISIIVYFLNRKQHVQDSKYAYSLLLDLIQELKASEKTKQRMDNLVCINVTGKPGEGIHRDKKCEHYVREVKNALKGTHSSLKDITVDKAVSSISVINQIASHDIESMLCSSLSSTTTYDYIGEERRKVMSEKVKEIDPFSQTRDKIDFFDKPKGTPFAGMTLEKIKSFLDRNKTNYKRRCT